MESKNKTKNAILKAARQLFVKHGFAGTSVSQIAKLAKVNHSLIFHHFENKALLWKAVKLNFVEDFETHFNKTIRTDKGLRFYLNQIIMHRFETYIQHPDLARMIQWQRLEPKAGDLIGNNQNSLINWVSDIKSLQKQGEINPTLDAGLVCILIASGISGTMLDFLPPFKGGDHSLKEQYIAMLIDCLESGLR